MESLFEFIPPEDGAGEVIYDPLGAFPFVKVRLQERQDPRLKLFGFKGQLCADESCLSTLSQKCEPWVEFLPV
jgi:hypothetical protein